MPRHISPVAPREAPITAVPCSAQERAGALGAGPQPNSSCHQRVAGCCRLGGYSRWRGDTAGVPSRYGVDANQTTTRSILQACRCKRSQRGRRSTLPSRPLLWARAARLAMSARRLPTRQAPTCRPCPRIASHRRGRRRRRHRHRRLYRRRRRRRHRRPHRRRRRHCRRHPRSHLPRPFSRRYPPLSTGSVPASSSSASAGPPATRCSTRASRRSARRNEPRLLPRAPAPDHHCDMC